MLASGPDTKQAELFQVILSTQMLLKAFWFCSCVYMFIVPHRLKLFLGVDVP